MFEIKLVYKHLKAHGINMYKMLGNYFLHFLVSVEKSVGDQVQKLVRAKQ